MAGESRPSPPRASRDHEAVEVPGARFLFAAGGTGGHLYPALAAAEVLRSRGHDVTFVGGERLESRLVPEAGFELRTVPMRGLARTFAPHRAALTAFTLLRSVVGARRIMQEIRPRVVVGFGGYPSLAPVLAAPFAVPVVLHEQNARLTLAHTLSLRRARILALSLPVEPRPPSRRGLQVALVGNPLRPAIRALATSGPAERRERRSVARRRFNLGQDRLTLLATGGSQGALPLNEAVPAALSVWGGSRDLQVLHVTGEAHLQSSRRAWGAVDVPATAVGYLEDMEEAYAAADIAVSRAGASTCAELIALGLPSVLVPYPHGPAQSANARVLESLGAARTVTQSRDLSAELAQAVRALVEDAPARASMAGKARELGKPDAAEGLADVAESALELPAMRRSKRKRA